MAASVPYGTWESPLSAATVAAAGLRLGAVQVDGSDIYWLEGRPQEAGRYAIVKRAADGTIADVLPREINVRSRVHEYGGGSYRVVGGVTYCSNFADQRVYRHVDGRCEPITASGFFYGDFEFDRQRNRLICIREDHTQEGKEPTNTLVAIAPAPPALDAARARDGDSGVVLAAGYDFYSTPRLSPDGSTLAWLCWRHPNMPWDGTELWVADVDASGALSNERRIAGGESESIYQPGWSPDGRLYFASDRRGYWQIFRADQLVVDVPGGELGRPQWVLGTSTWLFANPSTLVVSYTQAGRWHLATIDVASGKFRALAPDLEPAEWLAATSTHLVVVAGSATEPDRVVRIELATGRVETLRDATSFRLDAASISVAEAIEFPTDGGLDAHAFFYAPRNRDFTAPAGEKPPLVVISHGGPTAAAKATLDLQIQFWTTRGFGVVDVNYGGSSGYGRAYRERLNGAWGIVDVADVINAARFLAARGKADPQRLAIRGGSAGGYTTLAALTFHPGVFKAGASYFGVSDLEVLDLDTHKFESRYTQRLVGPYPASKDLYRARSPIYSIERLACPLILFQGLEDKIVPPNQSEMMAEAVRAKGLPVAYLAFPGEQHGFRKAETIIRSLEAELYFYGKVFGFVPADAIEPVAIDNLP
jgi:dipeptidyl aminopeptidase/acylaminoacyl peptidase